MRKARVETHQDCRSLLQKAVRRGDVDLTTRVARHLDDVGDRAWLRMRASVITFEDCWPLGKLLPTSKADSSSVILALGRVAQTVKFKDAAGLGTLAYALSNGDNSVLTRTEADRHIVIVANAIQRHADFWRWAVAQGDGPDQYALVEAAERAYRRGGWPWDRAFFLAATYLAVTSDVPETRSVTNTTGDFPFWVALDKHTPTGKSVLRDAARQVDVPVRQLSWIGFYCESALTNAMVPSDWWSREVTWRLGRFGLSVNEAHACWQKVRPLIMTLLRPGSEGLREHLDLAAPVVAGIASQGSLPFTELVGGTHRDLPASDSGVNIALPD
jgi:hypothetical protein